MFRFFRIACPAVLSSLFAATVGAQLYDNGPPDHAQGWEMSHFIQAEDFVLSKSARIDKVTFWEADAGFFAGSIYWQIYANTPGNSPGTLVADGTATSPSHVPTFASVGGYPEFVVTFDITPVSLPPGVYWLALHNGPVTYTDLLNTIFWETTTAGDSVPSHEEFSGTNGPWYSNQQPTLPWELACQIFGAPAPDVAGVNVQEDGVHFSFTTAASYNYQVEYKNNIADANWTVLPGAEFITGTGTIVEVVDREPNVRMRPHRFYRAKLL